MDNGSKPKGLFAILREEQRMLRQQQEEASRRAMKIDRERTKGYARVADNVKVYKLSRAQIYALWDMFVKLPRGLDDEFTIINQDNYMAITVVSDSGKEFLLPQDGGWQQNGKHTE